VSPPSPPEHGEPRFLVTAARRLLVLTAALLATQAVWFTLMRVDAHVYVDDLATPDLAARRAFLVPRVLSPDFGPRSFPEVVGDPFRGEWALVSLSMTAAGLAGMAQTDHERSYLSSAHDVGVIADRALTSDLRSFDTTMWGGEDALDSLDSDHGHVGYLGHLALILAFEEDLSPKGPNRALLQRLTAALVRRLERDPTGLAETYPKQHFVPDNAVALAAIALASRLGLAPPGTAERLLDEMKRRHLDPKTGLFSFRVDPGSAADSRGSGAAWSLFYLGWVDPAWVRESYRKLTDRMLDNPVPGIHGIREWPIGVSRPGDVDSGPLLLGLSPSATGFAIGTARQVGDVTVLQGLLDTAEFAGHSLAAGGTRRYLACPIVGDAILFGMLASKWAPSPYSLAPPPAASGSAPPARPPLAPPASARPRPAASR
jgi:hypothetical protein